MKRGTKIALICGVIALILVIAAVAIYFIFFAKKTYKIVGIEKTDYKVADFVDQSQLRFFDNNTFHVHIAHKGNGLALTGTGTYMQEGKTYKLTFTQLYGRNVSNVIVDLTEEAKNITCVKSGNRIKFTDHKSQIYYFG